MGGDVDATEVQTPFKGRLVEGGDSEKSDLGENGEKGEKNIFHAQRLRGVGEGAKRKGLVLFETFFCLT